MEDRRNKAGKYVNAIIKDALNDFVSEETIVYGDSKIERLYQFNDGAVVKYEWQSVDIAQSENPFNHRFTLIKTPDSNDDNLQTGVIKIIDYKK